jgi:hypothetical protein
MKPPPIGVPPLSFKLWSFGNMKPLHLVPLSITLDTTFQDYIQILIPANTWGDNKLLIMKALVSQVIATPNTAGGPTYIEQYSIDGVGSWQRGLQNQITLVPNTTIALIDRYFFKADDQVICELFLDNASDYSPSQADGNDHRLLFTPSIAPFDMSVDNILRFQLNTDYATSTDTCSILFGQAYIQSPVDLRRLIS